jgi:dihydrolipoamide dehydrogenase
MMDTDISDTIRKSMEKKGITIYTGAKLDKVEEINDRIVIYADQLQIEAEYALLSIGRVPDLSAVSGIDIEIERGRVKVDDRMRTSINWLFAPGDINGRSMLAHAAFKMGEVAAENAMGHDKVADLKYVPSCIYTMPEVGSVGMTEQQAKAKYDISIGVYSFRSNGRALASGEAEGFVKVITEKKFSEVLGVHIVGPGAAELINGAAGLMNAEVTANEIAGYIYGHPTYSEAFMEATADSIGQCLHLPLKNN